MKRLDIGINGCGRIGRAVTRQLMQRNEHDIVGINDPGMTLANARYLLKYDTLYGTYENSLIDTMSSFSYDYEWDFDWMEPDVIVDTSGNYGQWHPSTVYNSVKSRILIANIPQTRKWYDKLFVHGTFEDDVIRQSDKIISCGTCDLNAVAPVLNHLYWKIGKMKFVHCTTLHPWLSYQNLSDGPITGMPWDNFALGRATPGNLIPKLTTTMMFVQELLPNIMEDYMAVSFRVPTAIVSCAVLNIDFGEEHHLGSEHVKGVLTCLAEQHPFIVGIVNDQLVSSDFVGSPKSCWIDFNYTCANKDKVQIVLYYDNEWAYAARIIDTINLIAAEEQK